MLEQGPDIGEALDQDTLRYNPIQHDEYRYRLQRPDPKRRLRGDYNTFRKAPAEDAKPFGAGWTAAILGGGSVLWGTWSFRALPIDFRLRTHFKVNNQLDMLTQWGYSVPDWPIAYSEMEPFYNVAETLLAVSGDRAAVNDAVKNTAWFRELAAQDHFLKAGNWQPAFPFPLPPYPRTPVGEFIYQGMQTAGFHPVPLPTGIVTPGTDGYSTRTAIANALSAWGNGAPPEFWQQSADQLWSDRVRDACNMCGFCGEFLCWGKNGPKSGARASTLKELQDLPNAQIRTNAKAFEVLYDSRLGRATGVRYLDVSDPDNPGVEVQAARHVIVSCGAVQSARLLFLSGGPAGLGNRHDQLGRYATFHLFGNGITCTLPEPFQGYLHGEFGHTGNTASFESYFVKDERSGSDTAGRWWKAGTIVSTAKKNPLENADGKLNPYGPVDKRLIGRALLAAMERYTRSLELRLTGDDLPRADNRVDLDPKYVDEYELPVARITRNYGRHEELLFTLMEAKLRQVFQYYKQIGVFKDDTDIKYSRGIVDLIGDHQMGTCRMGDDPTTSVVDRYCRLHEAPNVFVVDSSCFPTGFGLNPMVTVVANALRVGTWIVDQAKRGVDLERSLESTAAA